MDTSIPCLVCNILVFDTGDDNRSFTEFLLRNLLEIPSPLVNLPENQSMEDNEQCSVNSCSRFLVTCEQCKESVKQASVIYSQMKELARKFRGIQKEIVETLKKCGVTSDTLVGDIKYCRKFVKDCDYNGFGFPFVVQDEQEEFHEEWVYSSTELAADVVIKQEERSDTDKQEILLIFPEQEEEDGDDDQVSKMDEEEEDDDSDYQVSEQDSDDESEKDDYQVSPVNSEDDHHSETDSEEEDDTQKEISSKAANPGPPLNLLSSFICKKCLQRFQSKEGLDQHDTTVHMKKEREPFSCPLEGCGCTRTFTISAKFPQHFRLHHRKPPFICKDCKQEFASPNQVLIHHKQIHPHPPPTQQPAIKPEKTRPPKKVKILPEKPAKVSLPRPRRGRPKKPRPQKPKERMNPDPDHPFPCPICHRSYKKFSILATHLKNLHPNNSIPLNDLRLKFLPSITTQRKCPQGRHTSKAYKHLGVSSFELEYPHIICKRNSQGKFPCPWTEPSQCPRIFSAKAQLQRHIKIQHLNLPLYTCTWSGGGSGEGGQGQVCGKTFATRHNYYAHYDEHRGTPKWRCEDCDMTFYRRNPFVRHQQRMHLDESFVCEICGKDFSCKEHLYLHRSQKHKVKSKNDDDVRDSPVIICDLCGQTLKNKVSLKVHMETKHEKVPGKQCCHLCDKRFRQNIHLNMHLWKRHQFKVEGFEPKEKVSTEDKFQCGVKGCRKLFLRKENLERHDIEVHGEDGSKPGPWNCKYCGKNYFFKVKMEQCEGRHENKESRLEKCEVCGKGFPTREYLRYHQKYTHKMQFEDRRGWRGKI